VEEISQLNLNTMNECCKSETELSERQTTLEDVAKLIADALLLARAVRTQANKTRELLDYGHIDPPEPAHKEPGADGPAGDFISFLADGVRAVMDELHSIGDNYDYIQRRIKQT
jgi:hypothetical protein